MIGLGNYPPPAKAPALIVQDQQREANWTCGLLSGLASRCLSGWTSQFVGRVCSLAAPIFSSSDQATGRLQLDLDQQVCVCLCVRLFVALPVIAIVLAQLVACPSNNCIHSNESFWRRKKIGFNPELARRMQTETNLLQPFRGARQVAIWRARSKRVATTR